MKKLLFLFLIFFIVIVFAFLNKYSVNKNKSILYTLNNKTYTLLTAKSPGEWEKGLMNYRKLDGVDGMIFLFPDKEIRSFWNKNTLMDLKLYWLNDDIVVGEDYLPSIEKSNKIVIITSPDKANKVIELVYQ
ncbi:DUF192 domain-containing protein [Candidatus Roizmanbacteria bacterium]|nr:DUF192 domain-containing protein [Candidatus Roizmanbacteria bacterium]